MLDINKTKSLIQNGLLDSVATWESYLENNSDWKETFMALTGPLILVSVIISALLTWLFGAQGGIGFLLLSLIAAVISIFIASFIFSYLASFFKGEYDFNKGFAALSLAAIPAYIGGAFGGLPFIGWLISIGLGIVSLVFLYQIIPLYLKIPEDKRVVHFVVSLIATFISVLIINLIFGVGAYKSGVMNNNSQTDTGSLSSGLFGGIERQANMIEHAENDKFMPPSDGKVTNNQIATLILNLQKTADYKKSQEEKLKNLDSQLKDKKDFSFSDIGKLTSGLNSVMSTANAEMEVVKTGGGNWAEHQWVKDQLRIANIQKDINDAVKHNFALYQKYADQLDGL
ncbi:MAG: Yip1 family protein [Cocleimonas sp.]